MNFKWLIVFIILVVTAGVYWLSYQKHGEDSMKKQKIAQTPGVEAYFSQGYAKENNGDYAGAIESYSQAIERATQSGTLEYVLYSSRAEAKQELKDYQGAVEDFSRAIELEPKLVTLYWKRAEAKEQLKDYQGTLEDLTKAISLPSNPASLASSYSHRAKIKSKLGDEAGAKADKEKELEIMKKHGFGKE